MNYKLYKKVQRQLQNQPDELKSTIVVAVKLKYELKLYVQKLELSILNYLHITSYHALQCYLTLQR